MLNSKRVMGSTSIDERKYSRYLLIIGVLFFVFGFVTWLGSVLIPYLKIVCQLNNLSAYLIAFSFYISYFIFALPSAMLLKKIGFKNGMTIGLMLIAVGMFIFIPAANSRIFILFLAGQFIQGSGLAILQTAANPYVVLLGPNESAARRISIMGVCNGIAGIMAPILLGSIILNDADQQKADMLLMNAHQKLQSLELLAYKIKAPYFTMGIFLFLLSILFYFSGLPEIQKDHLEKKVDAQPDNAKSIFQFPHLLFGVITLFLYVGVEVIAADTIIQYGYSQGISLFTAKFFTSFTLGGMLIGYLLGIIFIPNYLSQDKALLISGLAGIIFSCMALVTSGIVSVIFIAMLGLANALIYPSIWPLALNGLGSFTKIGSSLLIMAIGGGAFLPLLYGRLADWYSPHQAYWMLLPCYLTIIFYALIGCKWKNNIQKQLIENKVGTTL